MVIHVHGRGHSCSQPYTLRLRRWSQDILPNHWYPLTTKALGVTTQNNDRGQNLKLIPLIAVLITDIFTVVFTLA
jgi:hypothetical protein